MAYIRFIALLLLAADALAYLQVPLHAPKAEAFAIFKKELDEGYVKTLGIVGNAPWYPYAMNISVGTPPQIQSVVLTLSNSDSYIISNDLCFGNSNPNATYYLRNCSSGSFQDEKSSTFDYNATYEYLGHFASARFGKGVNMWDTMRIGDGLLGNATLGLVDSTELDTGFFGLSVPCWVLPTEQVASEYTPLLDQMAHQKIIESAAFSVYAVDGENMTGNILFGAVDKSKYDGGLQRIQASAGLRELLKKEDDDKAIGEPGYIVSVSAAWRSTSSTGKPVKYVNSSSGEPFYASIDPTFAFTNLPENVTEPLYSMIGHVGEMGNIGLKTVECSRGDAITGNFTLELGGEDGYRLSADLKDLVVPAEIWHVLPAAGTPGGNSKHCFLGVQSTEGSQYWKHEERRAKTPWVIGSMMLRNTYTVFDARNMEVSLAPLRKQADAKPDVIPFESLGAHAPDSEFVGFAECFNKTCEKVKSKNGSQNIDARMSRVKGLVIGSVAFITLI